MSQDKDDVERIAEELRMFKEAGRCRHFQAELEALERLLAELPADRVIERIGLVARKREVEAKLADIKSL